MLPKSFIPSKPFPSFKWIWAARECTEGLNDPIILLGVVTRLYKFNGKEKYSSEAFARELEQLQNDVKDSVGKNVNLAGRGGDRNLIRNSGQYWKALGLIGSGRSGIIDVTPFGAKIATKEINQTEFAAIIIKTLELPNKNIQSQGECDLWYQHEIRIHPLLLILQILSELSKFGKEQAYITPEELKRIVIPLSSTRAFPSDYAQFIIWNRNDELDLAQWPDCCPMSNDRRMAREFLLFLNYYGYLRRVVENKIEHYFLEPMMFDGLKSIVDNPAETPIELHSAIQDVTIELERRRVVTYQLERPYQLKFRQNVLTCYKEQCILTGVKLPEVLQAAHIVPVEYAGSDSIKNGLCMRMDMHRLFDLNQIRINPEGDVIISSRVDKEYGDYLPDHVQIPSFVDVENLRWRWDNYMGI